MDLNNVMSNKIPLDYFQIFDIIPVLKCPKMKTFHIIE